MESLPKQFDNVSVVIKANVYFGGRVVRAVHGGRDVRHGPRQSAVAAVEGRTHHDRSSRVGRLVEELRGLLEAARIDAALRQVREQNCETGRSPGKGRRSRSPSPFRGTFDRVPVCQRAGERLADGPCGVEGSVSQSSVEDGPPRPPSIQGNGKVGHCTVNT